MKTLHYSIIATLILGFFFTFNMGNSHDVHATCVTINGTVECSTPPPTLTSIQSYYTPNQTIHLVGVSRSNSMIQVDLVDPNNNVKNSVLFQSESSGRFQNQLVVPGDAVNGTWKINISSGITHSTRYITVISPIFIQTSFASDSSTMTGKSTLHCQNNYYDISYQIYNATVSNVTAHSNFDMIFDIQNSKKGIITVYIPKNFLRESIPTNPIDTGVFVNGQWLNSKDTSNSTHRIRTIDLPDGHFELEFQAIGYPETMQGSKMDCSVVPEFPIAIPVLLIGIVSVIIFNRMKSSFKI